MVIGCLLVVCILLLASSFGLAVLAWQETQKAQDLRLEMESLRRDHRQTELQLSDIQANLQATSTVLENRLTDLEASEVDKQLRALETAIGTAGDPQQIREMQESMEEVQSTIQGFQATLDSLAARIEVHEGGTSLPAQARIEVARQKQSRNLSCESSAVSMAAQFQGVDLSEDEALAALPLHDNPHYGFRGNVDGPTGGIQDYGVYAGPVVDVLRSRGLQAWPVEGGVEGIKVAIARGNPVIAWLTYDCRESTPTEQTIGNELVTLVPLQHVAVVTGYNADGVWANDPWDGEEDFYTYDDLERAMGYFDQMAIEVAAP
jgi:uncharacterized protein YvpB